MQLEEQVTNLELSKKLESLGIKRGVFAWAEYNTGGLFIADSDDKQFGEDKYFRKAYCWTVAELGELLKQHLKNDIWFPEIGAAMRDATYMVNEANARAKMLIYLIENKLIPSPHGAQEERE